MAKKKIAGNPTPIFPTFWAENVFGGMKCRENLRFFPDIDIERLVGFVLILDL
jgi:hypothetical protein